MALERAGMEVGLRSLGLAFRLPQYNAATITPVITPLQTGRYLRAKDAWSPIGNRVPRVRKDRLRMFGASYFARMEAGGDKSAWTHQEDK